MFFEGSLQDGISTALQQSKQVVCLVTDDGTESQQWENEFLTDDSIRPGLESSSVILRLPASSEEAGYLEALFPVPKKPTVVVIQNGQLREYIASGTSKEEFIRRLGKSIPSGAPQQNQASPVPATVPAQSQQSAPSQPSHATDSLYDDEAQPTVASANSSAPAQPPAPSVEEEAAEEKRFTAEQKGKSKARTEAEEEARRRVDERCGCEPPNPEKAHANEIKLRKQQANEERKRILKRIEDDKRARKEREAAERKERLQQQSSTDMNPEAADGSDGTQISSSLRERKPQAGTGDHCNLQIRLLDGTTIRNRFTSDATLGSEVRKWVNSTRTDGNTPYSFRVVLTPRPNKIVQPQEELKSLLSLGLSPSATLVLISNNNKYRAAYVRGGGIFGALVGVFSTLFGGILASLGGFFSFFFGGGASGSAGSSGIGGGRTGQSDDVPMENLRARRRDPQFYNGNSLSFEPRNEDDDEHDRR